LYKEELRKGEKEKDKKGQTKLFSPDTTKNKKIHHDGNIIY